MLPLLIPAIIGGVAAAAGGVAQGVGAANAANSQSEAALRALAFQREMYEQTQAEQAPWRTRLSSLMTDPSSITSSPAFQFRFAEGQRALERSAAARGRLASGGTMRSLARYGQGLASDEYGDQWNRLASLAGVGQTGAQRANYANQATQTLGAYGNAQAAGQVGVGNAISGTLGQLGGLGMQYAMQPAGMQAIPTQAPMSLGGPRW